MTDRIFLYYLTGARDSLVDLMRKGLTKEQVCQVGEVLDDLTRDLRAAYDQPRERG